MAKILAADDDLSLRELMQDILEPAGHKVTGVDGGLEALEQLRAGGFDLAILDVNMPMLGGMEALRMIRRDAKLKKIPVIMCTGHDTLGEIEAAFEAGASGYVVKPFGPMSLTDAVTKALAAGAPK